MTTAPHERARSRAESAATHIAALARSAGPGTRLGSREDLRAICGVSVGTLHEALRLLQSTDEISVRTGPGGGIFAGTTSPLAELLRYSRGELEIPDDFGDAARVLSALGPLIAHDAMQEMTESVAASLRARVDRLESVRDGELRAFVRASLDVFASLVQAGPTGIVRVVAGAVLTLQMRALDRIHGPIEPSWTDTVATHVRAVRALIDAIIDRDERRARELRARAEQLDLFRAIASHFT